MAPVDTKLTLPPEDEEWFCRVAKPGKLYLWGNDYNKFNGTAWAVTDFLECYGDVRWLWPGQLGEVVPQKQQLTIVTESKIQKPVFRVRGRMFFGYAMYRSAKEAKDIASWEQRTRFGSSLPGNLNVSTTFYMQ